MTARPHVRTVRTMRAVRTAAAVLTAAHSGTLPHPVLADEAGTNALAGAIDTLPMSTTQLSYYNKVTN